MNNRRLFIACSGIIFFLSLFFGEPTYAAIVYEHRQSNNYNEIFFGYNDTVAAGSFFSPQVSSYTAGRISFVIKAFSPDAQAIVQVYQTTDGKTPGSLIATSQSTPVGQQYPDGCLIGGPMLMYECFTAFPFSEAVVFEQGSSYLILVKPLDQQSGEMFIRYEVTASVGEALAVGPCTETLCTSQSGKMWIILDDEVDESCCSNVLFLPGIQGSRLFSAERNDQKLWEPSAPFEVRRLFFDESGESEDSTIYTREPIDTFEVFSLDTLPLYQSFFDMMEGLALEGVINEWKPVPYDWRYFVDDIVTNGIRYKEETRYLVDEIEALAATSKNGKVTIVAHSNGGLVAKSLLRTLEDQDKTNLIDRVVFVAVPQYGTPDAVKVLLHGMNLGFGMLMDSSTARLFARNLPGAYGLLPSRQYFDTVSDPVIVFDESLLKINNFIQTYGSSINNKMTLDDFLMGRDGRSFPLSMDVVSPGVVNPFLLQQANTLHEEALDLWEPPEGIELVELAGWGIDTIKGIRYSASFPCTPLVTVGVCSPKAQPEPIFTVEGDGTVVYPSALSEYGEKLFFDVDNFNSEKRKNIDHKNIFESDPVLEFILKNIRKNSEVLEFISFDKPETDELSKIVLSMHSPAVIHVYDEEGRHTGPVQGATSETFGHYEALIPNSFYMELGEAVYVGIPKQAENTIKLKGTGVGTFIFVVEEKEGDETIEKAVFADIPVTPLLSATLTYPESSAPILHIDVDGNGSEDAILAPSTSGAIDPILFLQLLKQVVLSLDLPKPSETILLKKIDKAVKMITKEKKDSVSALIKLFGKTAVHTQGWSKRLTNEQKTALVVMIHRLLDNIR